MRRIRTVVQAIRTMLPVLTLDATDRRLLAGVVLASMLFMWACLVLGLGVRAFVWGSGL